MLHEKYINELGWGLVQLNGKKPIVNDWPNYPLTDISELGSGNIGLNHGYSKTCMLDIDHIAAEYALKLAGINLNELLAAAPYKIIGDPDNPPKPLFRLPTGIKITTKQLRWPDPDGRTNNNGAPKLVAIFEFRGGPGFQDVLPPSIHPDTQNPYTWVNGPPDSPDDIPFIPATLLALWQNWEVQKDILICPWTKLPDPTPQPNGKYNRPYNSDFDVAIVQNEFNNRYKPGDILERNGYIRKDKKWLCPSSSTGNPGVIVLRDSNKIMSFHGSDPLSDGRPHDAYDCYVFLEHDGNRSCAWHTARTDLGLNRGNRQPEAPGEQPIMVSNEVLILKAMSHSTCGQRFSALWKGDFSDYPGRKAAELSLCKILAYWTGRDMARINTLFRRSGLYHQKWNRKNRDGSTYGSRTIDMACQSTDQVYVVNRRYRWRSI